MRWSRVVAVTVPPLVLAGIGTTHPHTLDASTAAWWTTMHILLVPLFPLLGVAQWVLVHGERGLLAWGVRVSGFLYLTLYGVVDALAGIGAGTLVAHGADPTHGHGDGSGAEAVRLLFDAGNRIGTWGAWAFLIGSVLLAVVAWRRSGWRALPGALVLLAASASFTGSHIYWPWGVVTMLGLALGLGLLAALQPRSGAASGPVPTATPVRG